VGRLIAQHEHTVAEIMKIAGVCRQTVFTYRDNVVAEGVECPATIKNGYRRQLKLTPGDNYKTRSSSG